MMRQIGWALATISLLVLTGCGSTDYLVPSPGPGMPRARAYQQSVEEDYHSVQNGLGAAISDEETVISTKPGWAPGYVRLAGLFWMVGQPHSAWAALETAVRMEPHNAQDRVLMGQMALQWGRQSLAMASFRDATRLDPANYQGWVGLGLATLTGAHWTSAASDADRALLVGGTEAPTMELLGRIAQKRGQWGSAATYYQNAETADPGWWRPPYDLAQVDYHAGSFHDALDSVHTALSLNRESGKAWSLMVKVKAAMKQED